MKIKESHILIGVLVLSMAGMGLATYLVANHYQFVDVEFCSINSTFDCKEVNNGPYSYIDLAGFRLPWSVIGLAGFVAVFALAYFRLYYPQIDSNDRFFPLLVLFSIIGVIFVVYLNYVELAVIHKICLLCVASHALIIIIMILVVWWHFLGSKKAGDVGEEAEATRAPGDSG